MADAGLVLACTGCCCGQPAHGGAMAPRRVLRSAALSAYKASDLAGRVRLTFADCLGPCSEANVVLLYLHGRPLWFRRMNTPDLFAGLFAYVREAVEDRNGALPPPLAARSFTWTGGGLGPPPGETVEP